jgi:hypothetical protein
MAGDPQQLSGMQLMSPAWWVAEMSHLLKVLQKQLLCDAANTGTAVQCYPALARCCRLELLTIALR